MDIDIRLLGRDDLTVLLRVAPGVFDDPLDPPVTRESIRPSRGSSWRGCRTG